MTSPLHLAVTRRAAETCRTLDSRTIDAQIELSEIPAPPFQEAARGARIAQLLSEIGLEIETDGVGNVIGRRAEDTADAPIVVSAHLDTVFPSDTDVSVVRDGDILRGPGISDDARGLAALLTRAWSVPIARAADPLNRSTGGW